jgi:hypothetical protein
MEDIDELANGDSDDEFYFVCVGAGATCARAALFIFEGAMLTETGTS